MNKVERERKVSPVKLVSKLLREFDETVEITEWEVQVADL